MNQIIGGIPARLISDILLQTASVLGRLYVGPNDPFGRNFVCESHSAALTALVQLSVELPNIEGVKADSEELYAQLSELYDYVETAFEILDDQFAEAQGEEARNSDDDEEETDKANDTYTSGYPEALLDPQE